MVVQSRRTKLDVANDALLNINERPLKSITGALGTRIDNAIRQALYEVDTLNDWSWLHKQVKASSWNNEFANISENWQRISAVKWTPNQGNRRRIPIQYISLDEFDWVSKTGYNSNSPQRPRWWTIAQDQSIGITPYPTDSKEQDKILFEIIGWTGVPQNDSSPFDMPEEHLELVVMRASAILALTHLGDPQTAGTFSQSFEAHAQRLRDKHRNIPSEGINMFRPRRL